MLNTLPSGLRVRTIGDPHFGRNFSVGTPIHRRNERAESQITQLSENLMQTDCDVNVMMGDIFDKFIVDPTIVMKVFEAYYDAAMTNPNIDYVLIKGNHDASKDTSRKSSFDLLTHMLSGYRNIIVVNNIKFYIGRDDTTLLLFCGYNEFETTEERTKELEDYEVADAVFGHWDIKSYGGDDHNLCPFEYLSQYTPLIFTGHVHTPSTFKVGDVQVIATGSMQPYSHGEDPNELLYVSRTLEQYEADPTLYHDKCLRLLLKPSDEIPEDIDCLQFTFKELLGDLEQEPLEVDMGNFNFKALFISCLEDQGVDEQHQQETWNTYLELTSDVEDN